jgi:ABC-type branched-subunit amino acid transport system ATPase component
MVPEIDLAEGAGGSRAARGGDRAAGADTGGRTRRSSRADSAVPQEANVFPSLSVWENLTIGAWRRAACWRTAAAVVQLFRSWPRDDARGQDARRRAPDAGDGDGADGGAARAASRRTSAGPAPALQRLVFDRIREINARGLGILWSSRMCAVARPGRRAYVLAMGARARRTWRRARETLTFGVSILAASPHAGGPTWRR